MPVCAASPILRATELHTGGGPWGVPKKRPCTAIHWGEILARARTPCQNTIEGHGAACGRGPSGHPEKTALDRYPGGQRGQDTRPILRAQEQHVGGVPWGCPEKAALGHYSGGRDTGPDPCAMPDRY